MAQGFVQGESHFYSIDDFRIGSSENLSGVDGLGRPLGVTLANDGMCSRADLVAELELLIELVGGLAGVTKWAE